MKKILSISAFLAAALLFTSCNSDVLKTTYTPDQANEISFASSVYVDTEIPAAQPTVEIPLVRNSADGAVTVNLVADLPDGVICPTNVNFAAGEYQTFITLDVSGMNIGSSYKGTIKFEDESLFDKNLDKNSIAVTLAKAYNWIDLGKGWFLEEFWEGFCSEVTVLQAEGFDRWRIIDPYAESEEYNGGPAMIEFWCVNNDGNVKWNTFTTCYDYSGGGDFIKAYWPSELSANYAAMEESCGFWEDDICIFFPCWYIDGLGGWPGSYYPIALLMPGSNRSVDSFIEYVESI